MPEKAAPNTPPYAVMEGKGAYNKYAKLPAGGAALALPHLEKAVQNITLDPPGSEGRPIVIADYGSSQGKNSLAPIQIAITNLRTRVSTQRPIVIFHIDQPTNDFNSLFEVLAGDPDSYAREQSNIFPCAIGRSFYEQVLPPNSVHLGWCSYAAVWLSHIPAQVPGHFISFRSTPAVREKFALQAAQDWKNFLKLRADELIPGGRLVVVLPALADDGSSGFENIMDHANAVLADMVADRTITQEERARMVLGAHPRRKSDLLAPFAQHGNFQSLTVQSLEMSVLSDVAWTEFEQNADKNLLATRHALFFRSVFMPSLASALNGVRAGDSVALQSFADRLEHGLKTRVAHEPSPMHSLVQTIVLAKHP